MTGDAGGAAVHDRLGASVDHAPLSFGQQALWLFQHMFPGSSAYNVPVAYRLTGPLRIDLLRAALDLVVRRHEALRTAFRQDRDGVPYQQVLAAGKLYVPRHDLSGAGPLAVTELLEELARQPFDLTAGTPMRAVVVRLRETEHVVVLVLHHIVSDGWSLRILTDEVSTAYRALWRGDDPEEGLAPLAVQYIDYARWQRDWLRPAELNRCLAYWERALAGVPTLDLTDGRARPRRPTFAADRLIVAVGPEVDRTVRARAAAVGTSLFSLLAAAFAVALRERTGGHDIAFGTMLVGRVEPELEPLIGYFVNLVVLRCDLSDDPPVEALARRLGASMLAAIDHEAPFSCVMQRLAPPHATGRNPIVQVGMQLRTGTSAPAMFDLPGVTTEDIDVYQGQHTFDLICSFIDSAAGLAISVEYSTEVFDRAWAAGLADQLVRLLHTPHGGTTDGRPR